jgi:Na+/melibiose symporter-like transporter
MLLYLIPLPAGGGKLRIAVFVVMIVLAYLIYNIIMPKKTAWLMSLVEENHRGRFTANKEIVSLIVGMVYTFAMGTMVDHFKAIGQVRTAFLLCAATIFVLIVLHTVVMLATVSTPQAEAPARDLRSGLKAVFGNKKVLQVAFLFVLWNAANYAAIPFYGTYQIKELGFSLQLVSIITIASSLGRIAVSRFWGAYADKHSFAVMVRWCFLIAAGGFASVVFSNPSNGLVLFSLYSVSHAMALGGINSALINLCYDYAPVETRSDALAFIQAMSGAAGFLTTLVISPLVSRIQNNGNTLFGIPMYAQQFTSALACLLTLAVVVYIGAVLLRRPKAPAAEQNAEPRCSGPSF